MKKITFFGLFVLLGVLFSPLLAKADLPPDPGWHNVDSCLKITNISDFSEIVLIGDYDGATANGTKGFIINENECIKGGYKFSSLHIYWTTKDLFKLIDLNKLKVEKEGGVDNAPLIKNLNLLAKDLPHYERNVKDNTYIKAINREYTITRDNNIFSLIESKKVTEYNNGKAPKVETFPIEKAKKVIENVKKTVDDSIKKLDDGINQVQTIQKRGFWGSIWCFFGLTRYCD